MTVIDTDVLRVVASMLWTDGEVAQNVYNCIVSGGAGPYDDQDVADDMEDWLDNMYLNMTTSITTLIDGNEVLIYKYDSGDDDWDEVSSQSWGWNPASGNEALPRGVAALIRLWTVDPDVQGKKYLPGFTEAASGDGLWIGSVVTTLLAVAADWYLPFVGSASGATFSPGVWSVVNKLFFAGVDHVAASAIPAYQRRRKNNVGI